MTIPAAAITACAWTPAAWSACADATTQVEMKMCASNTYRAADAELNRQYRITLGKMRKTDSYIDRTTDKRIGSSAALQEAQRAWIRFRDAQCQAEGMTMRGGTGEGLVVATCLTTVTKDRTRQLRMMAKGFQ